jgi:predicted nucleotidyltransferase
MNYGLSDNDISNIREIFAANLKVNEVILFGSRAMGNYKPGSDIDLAVVSDDMTFDDLLELESQLEQLGLLYKIDLQNLKKINDRDVISHISRVGKVFYKKEK